MKIGTILLVTLCWLLGSAIMLSSQVFAPFSAFLSLAYSVINVILIFAPVDTQLAPIYVTVIAPTGIYPGVFFMRFSSVYSAQALFS